MAENTKLTEKYLKAIFAIYLEIGNGEVKNLQPIILKYSVGNGVRTALVSLGLVKKENGIFVWSSDKMPDIAMANMVLQEMRNRSEDYKKKKEMPASNDQDFYFEEDDNSDNLHELRNSKLKVMSFQPVLPMKANRGCDDFFTSTVLSLASNMASRNEEILSVLNSIKGLLEDIKKGQQGAAATASMSSHEDIQQFTAAM